MPFPVDGLTPECREAWALARRLRADCEAAPDALLEPSQELPLFFPIVCVSVPLLSVSSLSDWLRERGKFAPAALQICEDRRLRGAVVAFRGRGLLFADAADTPAEQRFTWAHEAAHFLGDHYYPRLDAIALHGETILEVIDEKRLPTATERIDAALQRATLEQHVHLMARDGESGSTLRADKIEVCADAFACEILAPFALLEERFPKIGTTFEAVTRVQSTLAAEFQLPLVHATQHARAFVAAHGRGGSLADSLNLTQI